VKFLCLAYGAEEGWNELSKNEQDALLAQDDRLRARGDIVAAVEQTPITVTAWDGTPVSRERAFAHSDVPLAGFGILEAASVDEAIQLVAKTPCARAKGAIELRPISTINI
jgi:hypothetical protein